MCQVYYSIFLEIPYISPFFRGARASWCDPCGGDREHMGEAVVD